MNADVRLTPEAIRSRTFKKVRRGYRVGEVDQFLGKVAQDLACLQEHLGRGRSPSEPVLTQRDVEDKRFSGAWRGYAMHEVDAFLDEVGGQFDRLHRALAEAEQWRSARRAPLQPPLHTALRSLPAPEPQQRAVTAHDVAAKRFSRAPRGYRVEEVDQFLGWVAVELARASGEHILGGAPRITAEDVASKRFTLSPRGYTMHEVDDFLVVLATQLAERETGWTGQR